MKVVAQNKKALFDYVVLDTIEAGIALTGDEVKSVRAGSVSLAGAFAVPHGSSLEMINAYITPYSHAYQKRSEEFARRSRKLLLHKREIHKLIGDISRGGLTLIPLKLYLNGRGRVKVELALCRHKKAHQRKEELRERDIKRETRRELKGTFDY